MPQKGRGFLFLVNLYICKMTKTLVLYSGKGFEGVPEKGLFEVVTTSKTQGDRSRKFTSLAETQKYYNGLETEKALWQHEPTELLQCHAFVGETADIA